MAEDLTGLSDAELDAVIFSDDSEGGNTPAENSDAQLGSTQPGSSSDEDGQEGDVSPVETDQAPGSESDEDTGDGHSDDDEEQENDTGSTDEDTGTSDADTEDSKAPDGENEENSDEDTGSDSESDEGIPLQPLKANGKVYPIESVDELYRLASMGIAAHQKFQEAAEGRKIKKLMENNDLSQDDINLLVDLKKGDKAAVAELLNRLEIDPLDLETDDSTGKSRYEPKDYAPDDIELRIEDVVSRVKERPKFEETVNVIMNTWDDRSKEAFFQNPDILELLNVDMQPDETGVSMYDRVAPVAEKMKALDGGMKSDLEYYIEAGQRVIGAMKQASEQAGKANESRTQKKRQENRKVQKKKAAAAPNKGSGTSANTTPNFADMTDEELDKWIAEH